MSPQLQKKVKENSMTKLFKFNQILVKDLLYHEMPQANISTKAKMVLLRLYYATKTKHPLSKKHLYIIEQMSSTIASWETQKGKSWTEPSPSSGSDHLYSYACLWGTISLCYNAVCRSNLALCRQTHYYSVSVTNDLATQHWKGARQWGQLLMFAFRFGCTASVACPKTDQSMLGRGWQSKAKIELSLSLSPRVSVLELQGLRARVKLMKSMEGFLPQVCNCSLGQGNVFKYIYIKK